MLFFSEKFQKPVRIIRRKGVRRFTLRVCQLTGKISITVPVRSSICSAKNFLLENSGWVKDQLRRILPKYKVSIGTRIPVEGIDRKIVVRETSEDKHLLGSWKLFLNCDTTEVGCRTNDFLLEHAAKIMTPIIEKNAKNIGEKIKSIRFKDTKSRWGSCSSEGSLMINWRLIMAPPSVYRYVIIHEVSHLKHMNHSIKFWELVRSLHPFYCKDRLWLKSNGRQLKRFEFK